MAESENAFLPRFRQPHHVLHATTPNDPNLWRVRYDTVNQGRISLRWGNKMLHLGIRRDHNRAEVIALIHGLEATVIATNGEVLSHYIINPEKGYRPKK